MQNCPPAGRTETPQGFFFILFFYPEGFFFSFFLLFFSFYYSFFLFALLPPPLSHTFYIFSVFFLFILLAGRQPALLGVLNTKSSTQASDPTRNKFVCVCISTNIWEGGGSFFHPIYRYRPGTQTRDAQHICSHHNADALNHSTTRTWQFTYGKIKIVVCVNHATR